LRSNSLKLEWPHRSGEVREFPEIDRGAWLGMTEARRKIKAAQIPLLEELQRGLSEGK
jgi:predicted NUDIX family NTP pyrophosphohydrolase